MNKNHYVDEKDLLKEARIYLDKCRYNFYCRDCKTTENEFVEKAEIKTCEECGEKMTKKYVFGSGFVSDDFGLMILNISKNLSNKSNFNQYTYKDDMVNEGIHKTIRYFHNYNEDKGSVFNYITMICRNAFIAFIKKQKVHSRIKNVCHKRVDVQINEGYRYYTQKSIDYTIMLNMPISGGVT